MPFSALVIPVPEAGWLLQDRVAGPESMATGLHLPAHLTLLVPFAGRAQLTDAVLADLDDLFADVVPFGFKLDQVCRFPGGTVYLAPEPAAPFRLLTHELSRMFPALPPYGGRFDEVVPHLTVPLADGETEDDIARLVSAHGPLVGHARQAELWWIDEDVEVFAEFPFGTTAA